MITFPNPPDNQYKEQVKKIKQQIDNETDKHKIMKLQEELFMPNLFENSNFFPK